jgi:hypothetical protein
MCRNKNEEGFCRLNKIECPQWKELICIETNNGEIQPIEDKEL